MADVFISYHDETNGARAAEIASKLESAGIRCWCARRDVPPGGNFAHEVIKQIGDCKVFLLLLDEGAARSPHVETEVANAFGHKTIMPYQTDKKNAKNVGWAPYYLKNVQIHPLPDYDTLTEQIATALGRPVETVKPKPQPVEPKPETVTPEPQPVEPEPETVALMPQAVESKSEIVKSESQSAQYNSLSYQTSETFVTAFILFCIIAGSIGGIIFWRQMDSAFINALRENGDIESFSNVGGFMVSHKTEHLAFLSKLFGTQLDNELDNFFCGALVTFMGFYVGWVVSYLVVFIIDKVTHNDSIPCEVNESIFNVWLCIGIALGAIIGANIGYVKWDASVAFGIAGAIAGGFCACEPCIILAVIPLALALQQNL